MSEKLVEVYPKGPPLILPGHPVDVLEGELVDAPEGQRLLAIPASTTRRQPRPSVRRHGAVVSRKEFRGLMFCLPFVILVLISLRGHPEAGELAVH